MSNENVLHTIVVIRSLFINDVRKLFKFASTWVFLVIGAAPDIYNNLSAAGLIDAVPDKFKWGIRGLAMAGIAARAVKQKWKPTP
jgi:hypothetical protein